jgi:hypothetical protein
MRPINQSLQILSIVTTPLKRANLSETGKKQQELGVSLQKLSESDNNRSKHMFKMQQIHKIILQ